MDKTDSHAMNRRTLVSLGGGGAVGALAHGAALATSAQSAPDASNPGKVDRAANLSDLENRVAGLQNLDLQPAGVGAQSRSVALVLNDWSNSVMNYGAVGDGAADDTTAFINAMAAYAGRQVFVPPDRTYQVGAVGGLGPAGAGLVGVSGYNTIISPIPGFRGSIFYNPNAGSIGSAYGLIRDLRFDLKGENCIAIDLSHCDTWVVDRVNGKGGSSRANAKGTLIKFGAPSNSSSYNNVVRDCGAMYFAKAVLFGTNAHQNRIEGGTFTNNRIAVDCAPGGALVRPQIIGARLEANDVGVREGAQGGIYLGYFEDHATGDFSFTTESDAAVILPGTTTASTATPLHNRASASNLRCLSYDMGFYDSSDSTSSPAFERRRQIRTAPGNAMDPDVPNLGYTDLHMQPLMMANNIPIEGINSSNDNSVIICKVDAANNLRFDAFDRKFRTARPATFGGTLGSDLALHVANIKVVGPRGGPVANATDAASAIRQLNLLLARLRAHGLIAT